MRVVIDTNILVSGLLSPYGAAGEILVMLISGSLEILYDARILSEYEEVLTRPKFAFNKDDIGYIINLIVSFGIPIPAEPLSSRLRDADDEPFLEVVITGKAEALITGNTAHYPTKSRHKIVTLTPRQFLKRYF